MRLDGYTIEDVTPSEDASQGRAIGCEAASKSCTASFIYKGTPGSYDIDVQYFDGNTGVARFELFLGKQLVESWAADASLPSKIPNGDTSTRKRIAGIRLQPGDEIRITGTPNGGDNASLDYVEIRSR